MLAFWHCTSPQLMCPVDLWWTWSCCRVTGMDGHCSRQGPVPCRPQRCGEVSVLLQNGAPKSYLAAICHSCCCVKGQQVQKEHCHTHQQQQSRIFLQDTLQRELCSLSEHIAAHSAVPASVKPQRIISASFCLMASFIWACSQHWNISAGSGRTGVCPAWSCRYNLCG